MTWILFDKQVIEGVGGGGKIGSICIHFPFNFPR
jgi:hypothetical protein